MLHLVINLDRSPDRWESISAEFQRIGITPERISGVDGKELSDEFIANNTPPLNSSLKSEFPRELTKGEIGCFLSHKKAWKRLIESGERWACIVEDDVIFSDRAPKYLLSEDWIPQQIEIAQIHSLKRSQEFYIKREIIPLQHAELLSPVHPYPVGCQAYIISRETAIDAIQNSKKVAWPVDEFLFSFRTQFARQHKTVRLNPSIALPRELDSVIGLRPRSLTKSWQTRIRPSRILIKILYAIYYRLFCNKRTLYFK